MRNHWSLVLFTLLVQSAVGCVWCLQAALFISAHGIGLLSIKYQVIASLCLVAAGLAAAMTHLGTPGHSLHAARNIKRSWLSREIVTINLFAGALAIMTVLVHVRPGTLNGWILLAGSLAGGAAIFTMTRVYRLRTVPSWDHAGTPLNFLASALLLGGLPLLLGSRLIPALQDVGHDAFKADVSQTIPYIAVLIGLMLKVLSACIKPAGIDSPGLFKSPNPVMQGCSVILWTVSLLSGGSPGFQSILLILAAIGLVTGEILCRNRFYDTYQRVGL